MFQPKWAISDDVLFCLVESEGKLIWLQPFGPFDKMEQAIIKQKNLFDEAQKEFIAIGVEKNVKDLYMKILGEDFQATANRDDQDYLYNTADLIQLAGRKYHTKKNHLRSFLRNYPDATYETMTNELALRCRETLNAWWQETKKEMPDDPFISVEKSGVTEILEDFSFFAEKGMKGGCILAGEQVLAFTLGEMQNKQTVVIHVEKTLPSAQGAYAAINQAFLANEFSETMFVNRQEDMGLQGLRVAKEAYRPIRMIEKFVIAKNN